MNLLDRHIFKSVLFACTAAIALFAFVVLLPNVIKELLTPLLAEQINLPTFLRLVGLLLPYTITYALPMGLLTGVLLTLGRLSADSEITAMRAAGVSILRIARPVMILAIAGAIGALYVNYEAMPWARSQYYRELAAAIHRNPVSVIVPRTFVRQFRGQVIYVGERYGQMLEDVWLWQLDDDRRVTNFSRAATGRVDYDEAQDILRITLTGAHVETRDRDQPEVLNPHPVINHVGIAHSEPIPVGRYLGRSATRSKPDWLTYAQLRARQAELSRQRPADEAAREQHERDVMKTSMVLHDKFNFSLAVLCFGFVGVPLGIKVSRRETSANLGVAVVLVLGYYLVNVMIKSLDAHPELRPDLLLWLPNVIFAGLAVWLFRRVEA